MGVFSAIGNHEYNNLYGLKCAPFFLLTYPFKTLNVICSESVGIICIFTAKNVAICPKKEHLPEVLIFYNSSKN